MASLRTSGAVATELKAMFSNKLTRITIVLVILWCFFDALNRFTDTAINSNDSDNAVTIAVLSAPQLSEYAFNELNKSYLQYISKTVDEKSTQVGLTAAEQAKQQGELKSFFVGDNKLQLKAVLKVNNVDSSASSGAAELNALILITDVKSGQAKIEKFAHNSNVYGYNLNIVKGTQVSLSKGQGLHEITLTMYEIK